MKTKYLITIGIVVGMFLGVASSASAKPAFIHKMQLFTEKQLPADHVKKVKKDVKEGKPLLVKPEHEHPEGLPPKLEPTDKIRPPEIDRGALERGPDGKPGLDKKVPLDKKEGRPHDFRRPDDDKAKVDGDHDNRREIKPKEKPDNLHLKGKKPKPKAGV
ncbi:MAG: hypothetical protein IKY83_12405 [Proteobacteria bacterium]|nr:hypothetical protein [Pseudomonadota bacterium]